MSKLKVGLGVSYYGPSAPAHRDSMRALKTQLPIVELHGSAYPEMAYAELCRSAIADGLDVIVFASHRSAFQPGVLQELGEQAYRSRALVSALSTKAPAPELALTAVPVEALLAMSEADERTYSNTGILDTGYSNAKSRPFASPWRQRADGSVLTDPLVLEQYITPEQALLKRASDVYFPHFTTDKATFNYLGHAPITHRIVMGDKAKRESHGILHNYAFCVPTFGGLDHHQQDALWNLELAGCTMIEYRDCPYIDQARSELVRQAMELGCDGVFFVDHDIIFIPADALKMIEEAEARQDVVSAVYCMRKTAHSLIGATAIEVGTEVSFFNGGSLVPALYSGLGFSAIPKAVFSALDEHLPLLESATTGTAIRPYFALDVNGTFYSGEDASFCARVQGLAIKMVPGSFGAGTSGKGQGASEAGGSASLPLEPCPSPSRSSGNPAGHDWEVKADPSKALTNHRVMLDTRVRIFHRGSYDYGIEDHSIAVPRYGTVKATLVASRKEIRLFQADKLSLQAQLRAQGIDEDAVAPHSILEEQGPCKHCGCSASNHGTEQDNSLCWNCPKCPGYEEMIKLQPLDSR